MAATLLAFAAACGGDGGGAGADGSNGSGGPGGPDGAAGDGGGGPAVSDVECPPLAMPQQTATIYVDGSATGAEEGTKAAPFRTLATAFESAGPNGVVWVAAGTYNENLEIPDKDLTVRGGFASGFGTRADACATVIEAADSSQPVLHAEYLVKSFTLDGVSIQKGARGLSVDGDPTIQSTFTITSSVFSDNGQTEEVGGGALLNDVNVVVKGSVFRDNKAAKGAGLSCGGDVTVTIEDSLFERNIGHSDHGGGVYCGAKMATIVRNTFRSNEIGKDVGYGWGGGLIVYGGSGIPVKAELAHNVFIDNVAGVGGAVFVDEGATMTMSHDLIYRNRSLPENGVARGAAIYVDGAGDAATGSVLTAEHLTIVNNNYDSAGNIAESTAGAVVYLESWSKATFTSSIFWNNGDDSLFPDETSAVEVSYSIAPASCGGAGTCTIGTGVLQPDDVHFADEAADDYHEKSTAGRYHEGAWVEDDVTSPAVDSADPAASASSEPEPNGGRANLGVYGGTAEASKSP